mmetsp:Transcript_108154/g.349141  ORF Transcript_108154/g.349141 Transcript_108154/m.349141 type:complete len:210 (-) Transcript_108154:61-690(-)
MPAMVVSRPALRIACRTCSSFKVTTAQPMELCFRTSTYVPSFTAAWRLASSLLLVLSGLSARSLRSPASSRSPLPLPPFPFFHPLPPLFPELLSSESARLSSSALNLPLSLPFSKPLPLPLFPPLPSLAPPLRLVASCEPPLFLLPPLPFLPLPPCLPALLPSESLSSFSAPEASAVPAAAFGTQGIYGARSQRLDHKVRKVQAYIGPS